MMGPYLTYDQYTEYGGTQTEAAFLLLELKCRKRIDRLTDSRVQHMERVPDEVKLCMVSLIDMEAKVGAAAQISSPVATSFSTDGCSETYGNSLSVEAAAATMDKAIKELLYGVCDDHGVPLLYRGVNL